MAEVTILTLTQIKTIKMKTSTNQTFTSFLKAVFSGKALPQLKLVSILFLALLNATEGSSQSSLTADKKAARLCPMVHSNQKTKFTIIKVTPKVYTVFAAKNFPKIESSEKPSIQGKDDSETFNYEILFCLAFLEKIINEKTTSLTRINKAITNKTNL